MGTRRRMGLVLTAMAAALAVSCPLNGQLGENDEPVFDPGNGITPPKVVYQVDPKPDPGARGFKISGEVLIGLIVSSRGLPVNVHVVRSIDKDIDSSAVEAVRAWRFEPARKDGKPVAARVTVEIHFHDL